MSWAHSVELPRLVELNLTEDEFNRWNALAEFWNDDLSELIREVLNEHLEDNEELMNETKAEMKAAGVARPGDVPV